MEDQDHLIQQLQGPTRGQGSRERRGLGGLFKNTDGNEREEWMGLTKCAVLLAGATVIAVIPGGKTAGL